MPLLEVGLRALRSKGCTVGVRHSRSTRSVYLTVCGAGVRIIVRLSDHSTSVRLPWWTETHCPWFDLDTRFGEPVGPWVRRILDRLSSIQRSAQPAESPGDGFLSGFLLPSSIPQPSTMVGTATRDPSRMALSHLLNSLPYAKGRWAERIDDEIGRRDLSDISCQELLRLMDYSDHVAKIARERGLLDFDFADLRRSLVAELGDLQTAEFTDEFGLAEN